MGPEEIKWGLNEWWGAWPPSLPEFRAACLGLSRMPPRPSDGDRVEWVKLLRRYGITDAQIGARTFSECWDLVKQAHNDALKPGSTLRLKGPRA